MFLLQLISVCISVTEDKQLEWFVTRAFIHRLLSKKKHWGFQPIKSTEWCMKNSTHGLQYIQVYTLHSEDVMIINATQFRESN